MKRFPVALVALASLAAGTAWAAETALIPRALLFGNATRRLPQLSPDGTQISWLAPDDHGVVNVWARGFGSDSARAVTHEDHRPIPWYCWAGDGKHLLYLQDRDGDENHHLFSVDLEGGAVRDLTPYPGVRAQNVLVSPGHPDHLRGAQSTRPPRVRHVPRRPRHRHRPARGRESGRRADVGDRLGVRDPRGHRVRSQDVQLGGPRSRRRGHAVARPGGDAVREGVVPRPVRRRLADRVLRPRQSRADHPFGARGRIRAAGARPSRDRRRGRGDRARSALRCRGRRQPAVGDDRRPNAAVWWRSSSIPACPYWKCDRPGVSRGARPDPARGGRIPARDQRATGRTSKWIVAIERSDAPDRLLHVRPRQTRPWPASTPIIRSWRSSDARGEEDGDDPGARRPRHGQLPHAAAGQRGQEAAARARHPRRAVVAVPQQFRSTRRSCWPIAVTRCCR